MPRTWSDPRREPDPADRPTGGGDGLAVTGMETELTTHPDVM